MNPPPPPSTLLWYGQLSQCHCVKALNGLLPFNTLRRLTLPSAAWLITRTEASLLPIVPWSGTGKTDNVGEGNAQFVDDLPGVGILFDSFLVVRRKGIQLILPVLLKLQYRHLGHLPLPY